MEGRTFGAQVVPPSLWEATSPQKGKRPGSWLTQKKQWASELTEGRHEAVAKKLCQLLAEMFKMGADG